MLTFLTYARLHSMSKDGMLKSPMHVTLKAGVIDVLLNNYCKDCGVYNIF